MRGCAAYGQCGVKRAKGQQSHRRYVCAHVKKIHPQKLEKNAASQNDGITHNEPQKNGREKGVAAQGNAGHGAPSMHQDKKKAMTAALTATSGNENGGISGKSGIRVTSVSVES